MNRGIDNFMSRLIDKLIKRKMINRWKENILYEDKKKMR